MGPKLDDRRSVTMALSEDQRPRGTRGVLGFLRKPATHLGLYIVGGLVYYTCVTGWPARDAVYFIVTVLSTVGYGDLAPVDRPSRLFTAVYAVIGVCLIGNVLSSMLSEILDRQSKAAYKLFAASASGKSGPEPVMPAWTGLVVAVVQYVLVLVLGGFLLARSQGLSLTDAIYFICISATTVGLGDIAPQSVVGRWFAVVWLLFATVGLARLVSAVADFKLQQAKLKLHQELLRAPLTVADIGRMDRDTDRRVSKVEFLSWVLVKEGKVSEPEIVEILNRFDELDVDGSGELTEEDLKPLKEE